MEIIVKNFKSKDMNPTEVAQQKRGLFGFGTYDEDSNRYSEEKYRITFSADAREDKKRVLAGKIAKEKKAVDLGHGSKDNLIRLQRREG